MERRKRAVEVIADTSVGEVAIEHTRIEAYSGQIADSAAFDKLVVPLEKRPPPGLLGIIRISLPLYVTRGLRGTRVEKLRDELATLAVLGDRMLSDGESMDVELQNAVGTATLSKRRFGRRNLAFSRYLIGDVEANRAERISVAFRRKLDKLSKSADATALILESNDVPLSNGHAVIEAVRTASAGGNWLPDWIALLETEDTPWVLWLIKVRSVWWPGCGPEDGWTYLDPILQDEDVLTKSV